MGVCKGVDRQSAPARGGRKLARVVRHPQVNRESLPNAKDGNLACCFWQSTEACKFKFNLHFIKL